MAALQPRYDSGHVPATVADPVVAGTFVKSKSDAGNTQGQEYVVETCGAGERAFGVAQNDVTQAQLDNQNVNSQELRVTVNRPPCIARVVPAASLTAGDAVTSDNDGKAVGATPGDAINGYAMCDCGSSDAFVEIDLVPGLVPEAS